MLQIDLWKRVVIWALCALGLLLAVPNAFYSKVEGHNDAIAEIELSGTSPEREAMAAQWPGFLPSGLVNLGLDLRGGAHLLAEVAVEDVYSARMKAFWPEVRDALRPERSTIGTIRLQPSAGDELKVRISEPDGMTRAMEVVRGLAQQVVSLSGVGASDIEVSADGSALTVRLSEAEKRATDERTMQQSLEIIRRRIDEVGTREPTIQRQGTDRILIQVPGIGSAAELKAIIGTTAQLTFQPVLGRGSDPDASLYWFARMLEGGEDPRFLARRLVRMAVEDIGLADPHAQAVCLQSWQTYERLGSPEGELALSQAVIYLALAPKSNANYVAYKAARRAAKATGSKLPPKHILNAPTDLMKDQGYGTDYAYDHDADDGFSGQNYFPEGMERPAMYQPVERGFERDLKKRLEYFAKLRAQRGG